ncbi:MAG: TonB-dependent receptor [Alphaproteobacteria bacterium]|nr:TonB-dependent receptor [Alphaproteobacteria bacterium]
MTRLRQVFLATASAVALIAVGSVPSIAQDTKPAADSKGPVEKVTVTGSRIKRPTYDSSLPTSSITAETMDRRQNLNVLDALLENRSTNAGASPAGAQAGFGAGSQFVALFGLGSNRTLTLLNGRRFVGGNQATLFGQANPGLQVDLNAIPTALIERIDIVAVGGAPSYGADAIGGVVNIILKDDFDGYQFDGFYRTNEVGVGGSYRYRGVAGWNFDDKAGNVTISAEHSEDEGFRYTDSPFQFPSDFPFFSPNPLNTSGADGIPNNILLFDRRITALTAGGGLITNPAAGAGIGTLLRAQDRQLLRDRPGIDPLLAINPASGFFTRPATAAETALGTVARPITQVVVPLQFAANGNLVPFNIGLIGANVPLTNTIASGGDALDLTDLTSLNSDVDRTIVTTLANYDVADWMNIFFEGLYQKVTGVEVVNQPSFQNNLFGGPMVSAFATGAYVTPAAVSGPITVSNTYAFLTPQAQGVLAANGVTSFNLQRANIDINDDTKSINNGETYRFAAGAKGDFTLWNRLLTYDFGLVYGRSAGESTATTVLRREFALAIDAVTNAAGQVVCRAQTLAAGTVTWQDPAVAATPQAVPQSVIDACRPLNLLGTNLASAEAKRFIRSDATSENRNDQYLGEFTLTADLLDLPAGTFTVATGASWRQERSVFEPDTALRLGLGRSAPIVQTKGRFTSEEYLFEFLFPIFGGDLQTRFMRELTLEGNFRVMDNDRSGKADAGTWALTYRPFDWLKFRGNYTNSLRAPALTEQFLPASTTFSTAADPCDSTLIDSGPNPATRRANCEAEWLARGYTSNLGTFISNARLATVRGQTGGNPNLVPETSTAFSYGFVLQPDWFLDDFALAVDYTKINVTGAISNLNLLAIMQQCYDATNLAACPQNFVSGGAAGFGRGPDGQVLLQNAFNAGFINAGYLNYDGITASLDWRIGLNHTAEWLGHPVGGDIGDLRVGVSYQYYDNVETSISGLRNLDNNPNNTEIGFPEHSFTLNLLYSLGEVSALWQMQYQTEQQFNYLNTDETQDIRFVDDYQLHNATLRWDINDNLQAQVIVNNIFNTAPPFPIGPEAAAIGVYDLVGRSYTISATTKF